MPGGLGDAGSGLVWAVALRDIRNILESSGGSWAGCGVRTNGIWATHDSIQVFRHIPLLINE